MADNRLPDVVPATDSGKDAPRSSPGSSVRDGVAVVASEMPLIGSSDPPSALGQLHSVCASIPVIVAQPSGNNNPPVQIWPKENPNPPEKDEETHICRSSHDSDTGYFCFTSSDSGIDSRVPSPSAGVTHVLQTDSNGLNLTVPKLVLLQHIQPNAKGHPKLKFQTAFQENEDNSFNVETQSPELPGGALDPAADRVGVESTPVDKATPTSSRTCNFLPNTKSVSTLHYITVESKIVIIHTLSILNIHIMILHRSYPNIFINYFIFSYLFI